MNKVLSPLNDKCSPKAEIGVPNGQNVSPPMDKN